MYKRYSLQAACFPVGKQAAFLVADLGFLTKNLLKCMDIAKCRNYFWYIFKLVLYLLSNLPHDLTHLKVSKSILNL